MRAADEELSPRSKSSDEEESSEAESSEPGWARALLLSERGPQSFSVQQMRDLAFTAVRSTWHSFGVWLASCLLLCTVLQKLMKGYVEWLMLVMAQPGQHEEHLRIFVAHLVRSWFMVCFYGDAVRFCFWLGRDAWRADAYEGYRRAFCGLGADELVAGSLYVDGNFGRLGFQLEKMGRVRRILDVCMQVCIFLSFDVLPFARAATHAFGDRAGLSSTFCICAETLAIAMLLHAGVFMFAWWSTDVYLKVTGFREALRAEGLACAADDDSAALEEELTSPASLREDSSPDLYEPEPDWARHNRRLQEAADELNLCRRICGVWAVVLPYLSWLVALVAGIYFKKCWVVVLAVLGILFSLGVLRCVALGVSQCLPSPARLLPKSANRRKGKRVFALEAWGVECCGLDADSQVLRARTFACMILMQAALFAFMDNWGFYCGACLLLLLLQLPVLVAGQLRPWTWLLGLAEAGLGLLVTAALGFSSLPPKRALETLAVVIQHQCGLARSTYYGVYGQKVVKIVSLFLFFVLLMVLGITTMVANEQQGKADHFSMFKENATRYEVPYLPPRHAVGLPCPAWFELGTRKHKLSLSDFGLFSAIAYESNDTIRTTLAHFFPHWHLEHEHRCSDLGSGDWTTFFEFTSTDSNTTVFAVRGTSTPLDALNDMIIWMPATVMMGFSMLGPDLFAPVAQAIDLMSRWLGRLHNANFQFLEQHVIDRIQQDPDREYFITGHSLGGGLAKIVSMQALVRGYELPAVTFMSPGLKATSYLVVHDETAPRKPRDHRLNAFLRNNELLLTVMPENDIVSRVDQQMGQVIPVTCEGSPLHCHLMGTALCNIFRQCGSTRRLDKGKPFEVPCDFCTDMPCKPGVQREVFEVESPLRTPRHHHHRRR